jgi:hypothetical protein
MTETATRHAAGCPDGQIRQALTDSGPDYASLTGLIRMVWDVWDHLEDRGHMDDAAGDMFECIIGCITHMREYTGWGGVPEKLLR